MLEVRHVWVVLAPWRWVPAEFVIVHLVGNHGGDISSSCAGADVLAIATTSGLTRERISRRIFQDEGHWNLRVVRVDARRGNRGSDACQVVIPRESWSAVVGTMVVMLIQNRSNINSTRTGTLAP